MRVDAVDGASMCIAESGGPESAPITTRAGLGRLLDGLDR
jgi:hypothetical protein